SNLTSTAAAPSHGAEPAGGLAALVAGAACRCGLAAAGSASARRSLGAWPPRPAPPVVKASDRWGLVVARPGRGLGLRSPATGGLAAPTPRPAVAPHELGEGEPKREGERKGPVRRMTAGEKDDGGGPEHVVVAGGGEEAARELLQSRLTRARRPSQAAQSPAAGLGQDPCQRG
ncbi:unnamed protein product, partial [Urochloa humidicola]